MPRLWIRSFLFLIAIFVILFAPSPAAADLPENPDPFVAFLDELMSEGMREYDVPNAVVAVVRGDTLYALRGYGERDISTGEAIDPATTVVRVASVSKPVTATAIMTLVERGLINLDDDVNQYLSAFQVDSVENTAVTFAHLLTHSGGLDDKLYYPPSVTEPADYLSLQEAFASSPPVRYAASGVQTRYSNQGYLLLAYLIEQISGLPFEEYVAQFVFTPLEMHSSTFEQELPPDLRARVANRYEFDDSTNSFVEDPFIYVNEMPAGGLYTTAADMAHFMQMQLNQGEWQGQSFLAPELIAQMHATQFTPHEALGGYGYGFWRATHHGRVLVMHDGGGPSVSSRLILLPDENIAVFLAHQGGSPLFYVTVTQRILDEYFGQTPPPDNELTDSAAQFAGLYKNNRYVHEGYFRLPTHVGMELNIRAEEGRLLLEDGLMPGEQVYLQVAPGVFHRADDPDNRLAFQVDGQNQVTGMSAILYNIPLDFERAPWYESNTVLLILLLGPTLIFLLTLIVLPLTSLYYRLKKHTYAPQQLTSRWLAWLFALFGLVVMFLFLMGESSPLAQISPHLNPAPLYLFLTIANGVALLALLFLVWWGVGLWRRYWSMGGAVGYSILAIAALLYLWFSYYNSLLGYQL